MSQSYSFDIGHPAPDRTQVGGWMLTFALAGGAAAWSLQLCTITALTGAACAMGGAVESGGPVERWGGTAASVVNVVALAVAVAALIVSYLAFRRTGSGSIEQGVVDTGERRTRFMAVWGIFSGILFTLAIGFNTISMFWGGLCQR
jgi:phosphatidylglycerophosphate synthase